MCVFYGTSLGAAVSALCVLNDGDDDDDDDDDDDVKCGHLLHLG